MPPKPRAGVLASKRFVLLITPGEHKEYFRLAKHEGVPLAEIIRRLLAREIDRIEARDDMRIRRPKRKRVAR